MESTLGEYGGGESHQVFEDHILLGSLLSEVGKYGVAASVFGDDRFELQFQEQVEVVWRLICDAV